MMKMTIDEFIGNALKDADEVGLNKDQKKMVARALRMLANKLDLETPEDGVPDVVIIRTPSGRRD